MITKYNKFFAAVAGIIGQVVAANVITGTALHYAQVAIAVLTALSVYGLPNATA